MIFTSGENFVIKPGTPIRLSVYKGNVEKLRFKPQYLNIQQLLMASSLSKDELINDELISRSANSNHNSLEVINFFESSINNKPEFIENKINLAKAYMAAGRNNKAIYFLKKLINSGTKDARLYYYLAEALEKTGNLNEALQNYKITASMGYNIKDTYLKTANLLNKMGKPYEAAVYFDRYNSMALASN